MAVRKTTRHRVERGGGRKGERKRREKQQEGEGRERGGESKEKGKKEREGNREIHKERKGQAFCDGISGVPRSCHFCSLPFVRSEQPTFKGSVSVTQEHRYQKRKAGTFHSNWGLQAPPKK